MRRYLPLFVLLFPALELWLLIKVGEVIGALATIGLVIAAVFVGFSLLRLRGMQIARTMQAELAAGRMPSNQIIDTFCLMIAGCLFIFPGFASDILAVLLIIPLFRTLLLSLTVSKLRHQGFQAQTVHFSSSNDDSGPVTWTCSTYSTSTNTEQPPRALRGNAVVIDCEPEVITTPPDNSSEDNSGIIIDTDSDNRQPPR
jgi:Protein affecting phage T7 exclusion by the F plasmid